MARTFTKGQAVVQVELKGIRAALKDLKKFENPNRLKVLKKALRAAGNQMLKVARKMVRIRSGFLRKSLKSKLKYYKKSDTLVLMVGVASKQVGEYKGKRIIAHLYAHLLAGGHRAFLQTFDVKPGKHYMIKGQKGLQLVTNKTGKAITITRRVGAAKGNNFLQRAFVNTQMNAIQAARNVVQRELLK